MKPRFFSELKSEHKEALGLLQIGTFLEYFDLMLYVHMAFLLNELFFPKTDPQTGALLTAFAFCSTYVLRPVGGLLFGWMGDYMGRKITVIVSSFMMGVACILMANLPTYAEIGITAAWGITFCRVLQGLACQGEIIGAEIYLLEITKPPVRYPLVSLCSFFSSLGGLMALGLAVLLFAFKIDWRLAFWMGAAISSIGFMARTRLRETPEFLKVKHQRQGRQTLDPSINKTGAIAYLFISCGFPICFYLSYIHLGTLLKTDYGYSSEDLISHNFLLSVAQCSSFLICALLSYKVNPIKILQYKLSIFFPVILLYPYWMSLIQTPHQLLGLQCFILAFGIVDVPAAGVMMNYFPVGKRFLSASLLYAFSRIGIYIVTSFGMVYLDSHFHAWGIWFMIVLLSLSFAWAVYYFAQLEGLVPEQVAWFLSKFKWKKQDVLKVP